MNMDKLKEIGTKISKNFDVKYRKVETAIGNATIVYIDDLCNVRMISPNML